MTFGDTSELLIKEEVQGERKRETEKRRDEGKTEGGRGERRREGEVGDRRRDQGRSKQGHLERRGREEVGRGEREEGGGRTSRGGGEGKSSRRHPEEDVEGRRKNRLVFKIPQASWENCKMLNKNCDR